MRVQVLHSPVETAHPKQIGSYQSKQKSYNRAAALCTVDCSNRLNRRILFIYAAGGILTWVSINPFRFATRSRQAARFGISE
jgi:hypothetical protein